MMQRSKARALLASAALSALCLCAPAVAQDGPSGSPGTRISGANPGAGGTKAHVPVTGAQVYQQVCQACHMANAQGGAGAGVIPALANNPRLGVAAYPISVVLAGRGAMPWLDDELTHAQIAEVVGYVRTHFGNNYPAPVPETEVNRMAKSMGRR